MTILRVASLLLLLLFIVAGQMHRYSNRPLSRSPVSFTSNDDIVHGPVERRQRDRHRTDDVRMLPSCRRLMFSDPRTLSDVSGRRLNATVVSLRGSVWRPVIKQSAMPTRRKKRHLSARSTVTESGHPLPVYSRLELPTVVSRFRRNARIRRKALNFPQSSGGLHLFSGDPMRHADEPRRRQSNGCSGARKLGHRHYSRPPPLSRSRSRSRRAAANLKSSSSDVQRRQVDSRAVSHRRHRRLKRPRASSAKSREYQQLVARRPKQVS